MRKPAALDVKDRRQSRRPASSDCTGNTGWGDLQIVLQALLVAIDLLALFVALLRLDRQSRDRSRFKAFERDRLAGFLAIAVGVVLDALKRRVDLGDQLALAIAGAQFDGAVGLRGRTVGEIGVIDVFLLQGLQRDPGFP